LTLEQDGFLRPFDVSSLLWPAGYLLTLCVASPINCGALEVSKALDFALNHGIVDKPYALELGAGIGGPSLAMSIFIADAIKARAGGKQVYPSPQSFVVATDFAPHSLALLIANTQANKAPVTIARADHMNVTSLSELKERSFPHDGGETGFAIVLGSSLQAFFVGTEESSADLWKALDVLLDRRNPHAVAVLAHTKAEPVHPPSDGRFRLCRRISGDKFRMKTRSGEESDFVISVFQRDVLISKANKDIKRKQNVLWYSGFATVVKGIGGMEAAGPDDVLGTPRQRHMYSGVAHICRGQDDSSFAFLVHSNQCETVHGII
jgi:hypothetical protein